MVSIHNKNQSPSSNLGSPFYFNNKNQKIILNKIKKIQIISNLISINISIQSQQNRSFMRVESPFIEYIPECKKNMRRLRKKIYKYITSKRYSKKSESNRNDTLALLKRANVPSFLCQALSKKKNIDLNLIKNLNIQSRIPLADIVQIANNQEVAIQGEHQKWKELSILREKYRQINLSKNYSRKQFSKRTISSTEYEDEQEAYSESNSNYRDQYSVFHQQLNQSPNRNNQFNPFIMGNGFLQIQSSILSQQNLFK